MQILRRNFVRQGFWGLLGLGLVPATLYKFGFPLDNFKTVERLLARFSLKPTSIISYRSALPNGELSSKTLPEYPQRVFQGHNLLCIHLEEEGHGDLYHVLRKGEGNFQNLVTWNRWEMKGLQAMADHLQQTQGIENSRQLRSMLMPSFRTHDHRMSRNLVSTKCSSPRGFFTDYGYCDIKVHSRGNRMSVHVAVSDKDFQLKYETAFKTNFVT